MTVALPAKAYGEIYALLAGGENKKTTKGLASAGLKTSVVLVLTK